MELDFLPATVYQPRRSGPDPTTTIINKMIEEERLLPETGAKTSIPLKISAPPLPTLIAIHPPVDVVSDNLRLPGCSTEAVSPSSSVASVSLTWMSSDAASSVDTGTDFEDLCDPAEMSSAKGDDLIPVLLVHRPDSLLAPRHHSQTSNSSTAFETAHATLVAPTDQRLLEGSNEHFALPPALPGKVTVASLLTRSLALPSGPPSLDGSLTSDQLAQTDAPSTPLMDASNHEQHSWDGGIQLNSEALATLKFLSEAEDSEQIFDLGEPLEMDDSAPAGAPSRRKTVDVQSADCGEALNRLTRLEIPSPTDFLSSLAPGARHTWCPTSAVPPSSTTAERFYMCPWNRSAERTVEQIIEVDDADTEGPPTAQMITPRPTVAREITQSAVPSSQDQNGEKVDAVDIAPAASLDRTMLWLSAQSGYQEAGGEDGDDELEIAAQDVVHEDATVSAVAIHANRKDGPSPSTESDKQELRASIYLRSFMHTVDTSRSMDAFAHCRPRFDAMQTRRICEPSAHRDQLQGIFRLPKLKPLMAEFEDEPNEAQMSMARVENEREALRQLSATSWNAIATKFLNGGKLFINPAVDRRLRRTRSDSGAAAAFNVLDLGGQTVGDWAWHCAAEYPAASVYTVSARNACQLMNSRIQGPPNHQRIETSCLWKLPFPNNHFDVISARSLHMLLKVDKSASGADDEYDLCLRDCWRCLKPGGYLEFNVLDSNLINAGPLGTAMSVEFGFNLRTRGYDPNPTRTWLRKVKRAGFGKTKRAWMFLPMGSVYQNGQAGEVDESPTRQTGRKVVQKGGEPPVTGSTNAVACISGLVGLWAWERWLVKLQVEAGKCEDSSLDRVSAVVEEGRDQGAGWSCLSGWAMKPLRT